MEKRFINQINAGAGIDDIFVLTEKTLSHKRDGNPFLNVILSDKTGSIKGVMWDNINPTTESVSAGDFVHIKGNAGEYKGILQLVIKKMDICSPDNLDPSDFLPATTRNINDMFTRLQQIAAGIENDYYRKLIEAFLTDKEMALAFKTAPAAKKMHHAYIGGLLEHTLSMTLLIDRISGHYKDVDRDLLIAGAILHDVGKTKEFEYSTRIDYSDAGRLLNHIVIGLGMIDDKIREIKEFPEELALMLKHLVVSHHGAREFGSPEPPKTIEAVLLSYIDEIDAKINGIRDFISMEDPKSAWTSYHRLLERHFYMGKNKGT
ncbi:3'-5' exoribonuclease YhaM family protein [Thermodesulfobacteriota bacterium]